MYYYIINPAAGRGAINPIQEKLRARLEDLEIAGEFAKTTGPGDATRIARKAVERGFNTLVAVGGDGTVTEVINGVSKDSVAVGVIPIGKTNAIAERLGIKNWQQAPQILASRRLIGYGLIAAGPQFFLSSLKLLHPSDQPEPEPAEEPHALKRLLKLPDKPLPRNPVHYRLQVDNSWRLEVTGSNLLVENQKFFNPSADNKMVITIETEYSSGGRLTDFIKRFKPEDTNDTALAARFSAREIKIETDPQTIIEADGKHTGMTPITVKLTERRLRLIAAKQPGTFQTDHDNLVDRP